MIFKNIRIYVTVLFSSISCLTLHSSLALAGDHIDTQSLIDMGRTDAALTDLHAFVRGTGTERTLVLALSTNSNIPENMSAENYRFPEDLILTILIDNNSKVIFDQPVEPFFGAFNATVIEPDNIKEDITIKVSFSSDGKPDLNIKNLIDSSDISFFAGLRDDPFILTQRNGRNVASIVLEIPLEDVIAEQKTLLIWATSQITQTSHEAEIVELIGRGMYTEFTAWGLLDPQINTTQPRKHTKKLGFRPAVLIYDTSKPAKWPNGRSLLDDTIDPVFPELDPDNNVNDKIFLEEFPYLAEPH